MIIQFILLAGLALIVFYFIRERDTMRFKAGKKLLFLLFIAASAVSVIFPNELNDLAHFVGITRGADLIFYCLVVAFIFTTLNIYLKFKDMEQKIVVLTREITLLRKETGRGKKKE